MTKLLSSILMFAVLASLAACGTSRGYDGAFAATAKIQGNSHTYPVSRDQTFRAVAGTLVEQGFNIDQTDRAMGLIKATRSFSDPKKPDTNYHITATAYVSESGATGSIVTLSASQQTVLYRKMHSWSMLPIVPIPIPTGRKFETVTTGEGGIVSSGFYGDFFAAVDRALTRATPPGAAPGASRVASDSAPEPAAAAER